MRLVLAKIFIADCFDPRCAPDERTIHEAIRRGPHDRNGLPGRFIGRNAYVDLDALEASTGNALADKILGIASDTAHSGRHRLNASQQSQRNPRGELQ